MPGLLALCAAAVFGVGDFLGGLASRRVSPLTVITWSTISGAVVAVPLLAVFGGTWSAPTVIFGSLAGAFGAIGLGLLFTGLATGPFQLVSPVSAVVSGAVPVIFGIASGDRPGTAATIGLVLTPPAVWILAGGTTKIPKGVGRTPVLAAIGAGFAFGVFFICLDAAPDDAGFVPIVVAKGAAMVGLLAWGMTRARSAPMLRDARLLAITSGVADMSANGMFLAATRIGTLATVGALVSLYPAMSALLAAGFLGERLSRLQFVGFVIAIGAGLLLAV